MMILQLEQLMLKYNKTPEGIKAKEMLKVIKTDLKAELLDANGNPIQKKRQQPLAPNSSIQNTPDNNPALVPQKIQDIPQTKKNKEKLN